MIQVALKAVVKTGISYQVPKYFFILNGLTATAPFGMVLKPLIAVKTMPAAATAPINLNFFIGFLIVRRKIYAR